MNHKIVLGKNVICAIYFMYQYFFTLIGIDKIPLCDETHENVCKISR